MDCIKTGVINLSDLPSEKVLIGLKNDFKKQIISRIRNDYKIKDFCNKLGVKLSKLYNFENNEKVTLSFLNKITKELNTKNIEKNIEFLGTKRGNIYLKNPKLPFKLNTKEGARFISALLFDGGIDRESKPHYGNINKNLRKDILNCVFSIFGDINSKEIDVNRNDYFIRFPKVIGLILEYCLNFKKGQKAYINHSIPEFIFNLDKKFKYEFIRQAFDDDGSVSNKYPILKIAGSIDVTNKRDNKIPMNLMNDTKKLIENININPNKLRIDKVYKLNMEYGRKGPFYRQTWSFSITGRENLLKYYNEIGFNLKYKQDRLKKILNSYKSIQLRKGEIKKIALEKIKILENKNGSFTNISLAEEIKRSYRQTARLTEQLLKEGKIKIVKKAISTGNGWIPAEFKLVWKQLI